MSEILRNELVDNTWSDAHAAFLAGLSEQQPAKLNQLETDRAAVETETAEVSQKGLAGQTLSGGTGGCLGTGVLIALERRLRKESGFALDYKEVFGNNRGGGRCP